MENSTGVGYTLWTVLVANASLNGSGDGGEPGPPERLVLWSVLDGIIGVLGVLGNGLVLVVFLRSKASRNLINLFIINQSMIDLTSSGVFLAIHLGPKFQLEPGHAGHRLLCKLWVSEYVMWALFISSSVNLVCITLERYAATMKPAWYRQRVAGVRRRIVLVAGAVWASGFLIDAFWAHVQRVFPGGSCFPFYESAVWKGVGGVMIFCVTSLIPLSVMVFCYSQIIRKLSRQAAKVQSQSPARSLSVKVRDQQHSSDGPSSAGPSGGSGGPGSTRGDAGSSVRARAANRSSRAMRNVIQTMLIVSVTYAISWAPIAFNYVVYNLGGPLDFNSTWYEVTKIFVYANMCGNPFIYAMQYRQFQLGLRDMLSCCCCCGFGGTSPGAPTVEMSATGGGTLA